MEKSETVFMVLTIFGIALFATMLAVEQLYKKIKEIRQILKLEVDDELPTTHIVEKEVQKKLQKTCSHNFGTYVDISLEDKKTERCNNCRNVIK